MKTDLEFPYSSDWSRGYIQVNSENRKTVILYNSPKDRSSTAYSRYIMSVALGRYLEKHEQVDHIDHDKTNDSLDNLQILTSQENNAKEGLRRRQPKMNLTCSFCGIIFEREKRQVHINNANHYCSRECSYKRK